MVRELLTTGHALTIVSASLAQNLVPNSSFEAMDMPCVGMVSFSNLSDWYGPQCSSGAAYFHPCSSANGWPQAGAPVNQWGQQQAFAGDAYASTFTYAYEAPFPIVHYLVTALAQPLVAGQEYCFGLYANLAGRSAFRSGSLSALFVDYQPSVCLGEDTLFWQSEAQVSLDLSTVDTTYWSSLDGSFVADGGEQYLVIGNFSPPSSPDTTFLGWSSAPAQRAVYFLDLVSLIPCNVSVEEITEVGVQLFPNPTCDFVTVSVPEEFLGCTLDFYDTNGRNMLSTTVSKSVERVSVESLSPGLYSIRVGTLSTIRARLLVSAP